MWWLFEFDVNSKWGAWNQNYSYKESKMAWLLIINVLLTPFTLILDIITFPIQLIYLIALKKVRKLRNK
jgi:hypothetical protein